MLYVGYKENLIPKIRNGIRQIILGQASDDGQPLFITCDTDVAGLTPGLNSVSIKMTKRNNPKLSWQEDNQANLYLLLCATGNESQCGAIQICKDEFYNVNVLKSARRTAQASNESQEIRLLRVANNSSVFIRVRNANSNSELYLVEKGEVTKLPVWKTERLLEKIDWQNL